MGDRRLVWAGLVGVPLVIGIVLAIIRLARSPWTQNHLRLLICIYVVLQTVLLVWRLLEKR
jgi:hypothetical protein